MALDFEYTVDLMRLSWGRSGRHCPYPNLGDALSPFVVATIAQQGVAPAAFDSSEPRLAAVGTMAHQLRNGSVTLWGCGANAAGWAGDPIQTPFQIYPRTEYKIAAMRGPRSADAFRINGINAPEVYGDPCCFLPKMIQAPVEKDCELGVILHLTELDELTPFSGPKTELARYRIPSEFSTSVKTLNTLTHHHIDYIIDGVKDILRCKRIVSTSFHGMVFADVYNIPHIHLSSEAGDPVVAVDPNDREAPMDHRFRDYYLAQGRREVPVYRQPRERETDWEHLIKSIDANWSPTTGWSPRDLFEAFPGHKAVKFEDANWPIPKTKLEQISY